MSYAIWSILGLVIGYVGWRNHELKVQLNQERTQREKDRKESNFKITESNKKLQTILDAVRKLDR